MDYNRIGNYKGYEVFTVSKYDIVERECVSDIMYVIKETGEIVLDGEVVGHADLRKMSVDEYPRSERYDYFKKKKSVEKTVEMVKEYERGKRAEMPLYEEASTMETAEVDNLFAGMDMIDKYIENALAANLIEPFVFEPTGI